MSNLDLLLLQAMAPVPAGDGECLDDDTLVSAGSIIEVTRANGDVLHSETLPTEMHVSRLREDTFEACVLTMNIPRAAADLVFFCFEGRRWATHGALQFLL